MRWQAWLLIVVTSGCTWIDQAAFDDIRDQDGDGVSRDVDCDDTDDGTGVPAIWYADTDGDGFGEALATREACAAPTGYVANGTDCDDTDGAVFPGAAEVCNDIDDDCDGLLDDDDDSLSGSLGEFVADSDGDGAFPSRADAADVVFACSTPPGLARLPIAPEAADCDDDDDTVFPAAPERCDGIDNDCNEQIDDGVSPLEDGAEPFLPDGDADGWPGSDDPADTAYFCGLEGPLGWVAEVTWREASEAAGRDDELDCDDLDADRHPGLEEVWYDGVDADCRLDDDFDQDGDGHVLSLTGTSDDCDDLDPAVHPGQVEDCSEVDRDCSGFAYDAPLSDPDAAEYLADDDGDEWPADDTPVVRCSTEDPTGWVTVADYDDRVLANSTLEVVLDCDDDDLKRHPLAIDTWYDGIDSNCDGASDFDQDGDGEDRILGLSGTDCDDEDPLQNTTGTEICNGEDDNCNGDIDEAGGDVTYYVDADGDHWPSDLDTATLRCSPAEGWVVQSDYLLALAGQSLSLADGVVDCDDDRAASYPGGEDSPYDGFDDDCAGDSDYDADGDGFDSDAFEGGTDCDDAVSDVNPDADERCNDIDDDCNGAIDEAGGTDLYLVDDDDDGWPASLTTEGRCEADPGWVLLGDFLITKQLAGYGVDDEVVDCNDQRAEAYPGATDEPYDGFDDDCLEDSDYDADGDGYDAEAFDGTDCDDDRAAVNIGAVETCNGIDDDCNGATDEAGGTVAYLLDDDDDGWPASLIMMARCNQDPGWVAVTDYNLTKQLAGYAVEDEILDCNDDRAEAYPGATDEPYDGFDDDCLEDSDYDADGDGYDFDAFGGTDCDDDRADVNPGGQEVCTVGGDPLVDEDCDGSFDERGEDGDDYWLDADGDGATATDFAGSVLSCAPAADLISVFVGGDCDDADATRSPLLSEVVDDGIDQDCTGSDAITCYIDGDGDGHAGTGQRVSVVGACTDPDTYALSDDCDDDDDTIAPGILDICDGIDNDCDGVLAETITGYNAGDPIDLTDDLAVDLSNEAVIYLADYDEVRICGGVWNTILSTDGALPTQTLRVVGQDPGLEKAPGEDDLPDLYEEPTPPMTSGSVGPTQFDPLKRAFIASNVSGALLQGSGTPARLEIEQLTFAPNVVGTATLDTRGIDEVVFADVAIAAAIVDFDTDVLDATELTLLPDNPQTGAALTVRDPFGVSTIEDLTIEGAGLSVLGGQVDVERAEIVDGALGIHVAFDAELALRDTEISGHDQAGVVDGTLNLTTSQVRSNGSTAGAIEGHIYVSSSGVLTASGSDFASNQGTLGGALFADDGSFVVLANSTFSGNLATLGGGAVLRGVTTMVDTRWTDNNAIYGGAAVLEGSAQVVQSSFSANRATNTGGALQLGDPDGQLAVKGLRDTFTNVLLSNGRIDENNAELGGGAIQVENGAELQVQRISMALNTTSSGSGGALSIEDGAAQVSESDFIDNAAGPDAGGVYVGVDGELEDCDSLWDHNVANGGGAWTIAGVATLGGEGIFDSNSGGKGPLARILPTGSLTRADCGNPTANLTAQGHSSPAVYVENGGHFDLRGWSTPMGEQFLFDEATGLTTRLQ